MKIENFYDPNTATFTHIVICEESKKCAVIDSVMDYDIFSGKISYSSAQKIIAYIKENNLTLEWILETHVHADHLTGASYLKENLGGKIAIGSEIKKVLQHWVPFFNIAKDTPIDGSQFDHLFVDGEKFFIGNLEVIVMHTPGHTPACACYLIGSNIFVGDTIFLPAMGTARTDFPGGSARQLYGSIQKILSLPNETKIFVGHDYPAEGKQPQAFCSVLEQKQSNILVNEKISEEQYVETRNKRDVGKAVPKLIMPSLQVNLRAGKFGEAEDNGAFYLKMPVSQT